MKELRLQGISDIVAANDFLDAHFRDDFNRRFARAPESDLDAHRPLLLTAPLADIFQLQARRKVSRQLTVNYQRTLYVLEKTESARATMGKHVMLYEDDAGRVTIRTEAGGDLRAEAFDRVPKARFSQEMWWTTSCSAAHWRWLGNSKSTPRTSGSSTLGPSGSAGWRQRAWRRLRLDDDQRAVPEPKDVARWTPVQRTFLSYGEEDISTLREQRV